VTKKRPEGKPAVARPKAGSSGDPPDGSVDEAAPAPAAEPAVEEPTDGGSAAAPGPSSAGDLDGVPDEPGPDEPGPEPSPDLSEDPEERAARAERALAERTLDLQRLQAEYLNYKRRVDRDRELVRENATFAALAPIVEVLDTIDRARDHGDLDPGFKAVADQLERVVADAGLVRYGEPGDAFDPRLHEALSHIGEDPEVEVTTAKVIAKAGYRIGDRVVRVAQVLVVDPPQA
jgi:molecular chaperone GrpE